MDSNPKKHKPKLRRSNALKNVQYEPSSHDLCSSSLETSLLDGRTSFRVQDIEGIDLVCRILGLSGPEEFEIPIQAWNSIYTTTIHPPSTLSQVPFQQKIRVSESDGIKGSRPPHLALAPPPPMTLPPTNQNWSSWDLMKSFAPDSDLPSPLSSRSSSDDAVACDPSISVDRAEMDGVRLGETMALSESCSFTTSTDDDSSSTTTEQLLSTPIRRFRGDITYWEKGALLGRGSFGSVYEGIANGGNFIAIKEVSLLDQGSQGKQSIFQLEQEIALLRGFEHENIVQYYGTFKDESNLYIFLELVSKGSLQSLYRSYNLQDSHVSAYTRQILHGLKYLHGYSVMHRDIKCANILVDANGSVKLADFGLAKATKLNDVKSCKGTPFWMAPEVVNQKGIGYGLAADIWSLGCTVLEMLTRQFPYSHLESVQALFRIGKGEPPPVPDTLSDDARDFILKCVQVKPDLRPTASQLLDHPFVKRQLPNAFAASPQTLCQQSTV